MTWTPYLTKGGRLRKCPPPQIGGFPQICRRQNLDITDQNLRTNPLRTAPASASMQQPQPPFVPLAVIRLDYEASDEQSD